MGSGFESRGVHHRESPSCRPTGPRDGVSFCHIPSEGISAGHLSGLPSLAKLPAPTHHRRRRDGPTSREPQTVRLGSGSWPPSRGPSLGKMNISRTAAALLLSAASLLAPVPAHAATVCYTATNEARDCYGNGGWHQHRDLVVTPTPSPTPLLANRGQVDFHRSFSGSTREQSRHRSQWAHQWWLHAEVRPRFDLLHGCDGRPRD